MKSWIFSLGFVGIVSAVGCTQPVGTAGEDSKTTAPLAEGEKSVPKMAPVSLDAKFDRWLLSPTGEVHAMMLDNASIVHLRLADGFDTASLKKGDALHVEGKRFGESQVLGMAEVKKDGAVIIAAPQVPSRAPHEGEHPGKLAHHGKGEHRAHEKTGEHKGDPGKHFGKLAALTPMTAEARVDVLLPGRHGHTHGYVLSDGTVAYLPHHAQLEGVTINKGDTIKVEGRGGSYALGKALEIKTITVNGTTKTL